MGDTEYIPCPHCQNFLVADPSLAGQTVQCPHCNGLFQRSGGALPALAFPANPGTLRTVETDCEPDDAAGAVASHTSHEETKTLRFGMADGAKTTMKHALGGGFGLFLGKELGQFAGCLVVSIILAVGLMFLVIVARISESLR